MRSHTDSVSDRMLPWSSALTGSAVAVRDSKHPAGGALIVTPRAWTAFTTTLRDGELG